MGPEKPRIYHFECFDFHFILCVLVLNANFCVWFFERMLWFIMEKFGILPNTKSDLMRLKFCNYLCLTLFCASCRTLSFQGRSTIHLGRVPKLDSSYPRGLR